MSLNRQPFYLHRMEIAFCRDMAFRRRLPNSVIREVATKCTSKSKQIATVKCSAVQPFHGCIAMRFRHVSTCGESHLDVSDAGAERTGIRKTYSEIHISLTNLPIRRLSACLS